MRQTGGVERADGSIEVAKARLLAVFAATAAERLGQMRLAFGALPGADADEARGLLYDLELHAHTLHGGAAVVGVADVRDAAAALEELLTRCRGDELAEIGRALEELGSRIEGVAAPAPSTPAPPASSGERPTHTHTIVHVDDDATMRLVVEQMLEERDSVRLVSLGEGAGATEVVSAEHASLVLLDLHLPDVSGRAVLSSLRADPRTRDVPVLILSGGADDGPDENTLGGPIARLDKPFDLVTFLGLVDDLCDLDRPEL